MQIETEERFTGPGAGIAARDFLAARHFAPVRGIMCLRDDDRGGYLHAGIVHDGRDVIARISFESDAEPGEIVGSPFI